MSSRRMKGPPPEVDYSHLLDEMRKKVGQVDTFHKGANWMRKQGDSTLLRFLSGHDGDVDKAVESFKKGSKKRWEAAADTWIEGYDKDLTAETTLVKGNFPGGVTGRDHRGKPVQYIHLTAIDFPGLVSTVGMNAIVKHMIFQIENLLTEYPEGGALLIIDLGLDAFSTNFQDVRIWTQSFVSFAKKMGGIFECYPESYSQIIFTRAPKIFWGTWKVAKNFIPDRTLQKVKILAGAEGKDPLPFLLELMDSEAIPEELKGTSRVVLGVGGKVPKNALADDDYITQLRAHVRIMQGDFANGRQSARYSNLRTQAEENDLQEQLALEMLKMQIEEAKASTKNQASSRGSWRFEPGLDVLDQVDDKVLLDELKSENFEPTKALERLKLSAARSEGIKVPQSEEAATPAAPADGAEDDEDKKNCMIM